MSENVIYRGKSPEQRIADRLKPSAGNPPTASTQVTHGSGPTRVVSTIHHYGQQCQHGPGVGGHDISGGKR